MSYPVVKQLRFPIEPYELSDDYWKFGDRVPRRFGLWGVHLGDDVVVATGTACHAIGDGEVVLAQTIRGSEEKRSWGGVVIIGHRLTNDAVFYSVYGHMSGVVLNVGDRVVIGQEVGVVADSFTPENGWWKMPHLHFGIYDGPWSGTILPGYWRPDRFWVAKRKWWHDPRSFINSMNDREDAPLRP